LCFFIIKQKMYACVYTFNMYVTTSEIAAVVMYNDESYSCEYTSGIDQFLICNTN